MKLPDTDNLQFQHAFKQGYRFALQGKSPIGMSSVIRRDMTLRDYFQQGWEQAQEDIALNLEVRNKPNWRGRIAWFSMMLIGGISTSLLMIHNIEQEKTEQLKPIENPVNTALKPTAITNTSSAITSSSNTLNQESLSILSAEQRTDLSASQKEIKQNTLPDTPLQPVVASDIKVSDALLTTAIQGQKPTTVFEKTVPKYIRELTFFTQIDFARHKTISHRWRFNNRYQHTVPLQITSDHQKHWSSIKLSSAWQGEWVIDVLNQNQEVIYRKRFIYGAVK